MGRGVLFGVALLSVIFPALAGTASAQEYNHVITVYASVPEQRGVYVDKYGNIVKVAGNTFQNIAPQVYDLNNHTLSMTPAIQTKYDAFLKSHSYRLEAGQTYIISQVVTVNTQPLSQNIEVGSALPSDLQLSIQF